MTSKSLLRRLVLSFTKVTRSAALTVSIVFGGVVVAEEAKVSWVSALSPSSMVQLQGRTTPEGTTIVPLVLGGGAIVRLEGDRVLRHSWLGDGQGTAREIVFSRQGETRFFWNEAASPVVIFFELDGVLKQEQQEEFLRSVYVSKLATVPLRRGAKADWAVFDDAERLRRYQVGTVDEVGQEVFDEVALIEARNEMKLTVSGGTAVVLNVRALMNLSDGSGSTFAALKFFCEEFEEQASPVTNPSVVWKPLVFGRGNAQLLDGKGNRVDGVGLVSEETKVVIRVPEGAETCFLESSQPLLLRPLESRIDSPNVTLGDEINTYEVSFIRESLAYLVQGLSTFSPEVSAAPVQQPGLYLFQEMRKRFSSMAAQGASSVTLRKLLGRYVSWTPLYFVKDGDSESVTADGFWQSVIMPQVSYERSVVVPQQMPTIKLQDRARRLPFVSLSDSWQAVLPDALTGRKLRLTVLEPDKLSSRQLVDVRDDLGGLNRLAIGREFLFDELKLQVPTAPLVVSAVTFEVPKAAKTIRVSARETRGLDVLFSAQIEVARPEKFGSQDAAALAMACDKTHDGNPCLNALTLLGASTKDLSGKPEADFSEASVLLSLAPQLVSLARDLQGYSRRYLDKQLKVDSDLYQQAVDSGSVLSFAMKLASEMPGVAYALLSYQAVQSCPELDAVTDDEEDQCLEAIVELEQLSGRYPRPSATLGLYSYLLMNNRRSEVVKSLARVLSSRAESRLSALLLGLKGEKQPGFSPIDSEIPVLPVEWLEGYQDVQRGAGGNVKVRVGDGRAATFRVDSKALYNLSLNAIPDDSSGNTAKCIKVTQGDRDLYSYVAPGSRDLTRAFDLDASEPVSVGVLGGSMYLVVAEQGDGTVATSDVATSMESGFDQDFQKALFDIDHDLCTRQPIGSASAEVHAKLLSAQGKFGGHPEYWQLRARMPRGSWKTVDELVLSHGGKITLPLLRGGANSSGDPLRKLISQRIPSTARSLGVQQELDMDVTVVEPTRMRVRVVMVPLMEVGDVSGSEGGSATAVSVTQSGKEKRYSIKGGVSIIAEETLPKGRHNVLLGNLVKPDFTEVYADLELLQEGNWRSIFSATSGSRQAWYIGDEAGQIRVNDDQSGFYRIDVRQGDRISQTVRYAVPRDNPIEIATGTGVRAGKVTNVSSASKVRVYRWHEATGTQAQRTEDALTESELVLPNLSAVSAEGQLASLSLVDRQPLPSAELGTVTIASELERRRMVEESVGVNGQTFAGVSAEYRKALDDNQVYSTSSVRVRQFEGGNAPSLAASQEIEYFPEFSDFRFSGDAYGRLQSIESQSGSNDTAHNVGARVQAGYAPVLADTVQATSSVQLFARDVEGFSNGDSPNQASIDQDVVSAFKLDHQFGAVVGERLSFLTSDIYQPFVEAFAQTNEDFDLSSPDNLSARVGLRTFFSGYTSGLWYRAQHFQSDKDRSDSLTRHYVGASIARDFWLYGGDRVQVSLDALSEPSEGEVFGGVVFGYSWDQGRGFADYSPGSIPFRGLRQAAQHEGSYLSGVRQGE